MRIQDYSHHAGRTLPPEWTQTELILNAALGLAEESAEILEIVIDPAADAELGKEVGDLLWYANEMALAAGTTLDEVTALAAEHDSTEQATLTFGAFQSGCPQETSTVLEAASVLAVRAGRLTGRAKKHVHHGHEWEPLAARTELGHVLRALASLAMITGTSLDEAAAANIRKLEARYPDGFTHQRSVHRDAG